MSKLDKLTEALAGRLNEIRQAEKAAALEADRKAAEAEEAYRKKLEEDPEYKAYAEWKARRPGNDKRMDREFHETVEEYRGRKFANAAPAYYAQNPEKAERATKFWTNVVDGLVFNNREAKDALSEGTDADGGYTVPTEIGSDILRYAKERSVIAQEARVVNMSRDKITFPMKLTGPSVYKIAENATISGTKPTFTEVELDTDLYGCIITASNQLLSDTAYQLVDYLNEETGQEFAYKWDYEGFVGTDWTPIIGNCGSTVTVSGSFANLTTSICTEAESKIIVPERAGCKWYVSRTDYHYISQVKDTTGQPLFRDPKNGGLGLYGYPVVIVEKLTAGKMVLGNLKKGYMMGLRQGLSVDVSREAGDLWPKNQTGFRFIARMDGTVGLANTMVQISVA